VTVFASDHAQQNKLDAMRQLGAEIHLVPGGYGEAEQAGIDYARSAGATWVSPYNDAMVIAGQGTIALEVFDNLPEPGRTTWVVPAGGGGLISGIGCAFQGVDSKPRLIAVQSQASAFLYEIYHRGTQAGVVEQPSIADGLAGPVEEGSVTVPLVKSYVTDFLLVSEVEICQAIKYAWLKYHEKIEGSAAVTLAAILSGRVSNKPAVLVITGGNIEPADHDKIINDNSI
jgi:threonine dehydratase